MVPLGSKSLYGIPGRPDSEIGDSFPALMNHALRVDGEINLFQSIELKASRLVRDPLVLHGNLLIPSHNDRSPRVFAKISTLSRRTECVEENFQLLRDRDSHQRRL